MGPGGGPGQIFLPKFLKKIFRSPCKIWEPYDNPCWKNSDGGRKRKRREKKENKLGLSCAKLRLSFACLHRRANFDNCMVDLGLTGKYISLPCLCNIFKSE